MLHRHALLVTGDTSYDIPPCGKGSAQWFLEQAADGAKGNGQIPCADPERGQDSRQALAFPGGKSSGEVLL